MIGTKLKTKCSMSILNSVQMGHYFILNEPLLLQLVTIYYRVRKAFSSSDYYQYLPEDTNLSEDLQLIYSSLLAEQSIQD